MKSRYGVPLVVVSGVVLVGAAWLWASGQGHEDQSVPVETSWPALPRVVEIEVLNAGGQSGAALDATRRLRQGGLDVVLWGDADHADIDPTRSHPAKILVRAGDTLGVGRIKAILGDADVVDAPDDRDLVALTVLIYRDSTP